MKNSLLFQFIVLSMMCYVDAESVVHLVDYYFNSTSVLLGESKKIGLAGFTRHPIRFLLFYSDEIDFSTVPFPAIFHEKGCLDSVERIVRLCVLEKIELLIVGYLPVYYNEIILKYSIERGQKYMNHL